MPQRRGADARVSINGVLHAVASIGVSAHVADIITSNSEGQPGNPLVAALLGVTSRIADLPDGEIVLASATFNDDDNPFAQPVGFILGGYYSVSVYPCGVASPLVYAWGNMLLCSFDHNIRIPGPQPLTLHLKPDGIDVLTMLGI